MATKRIPVLTETWNRGLCLQAFPVSSWAWVLRLQGDVDASNVKLLEGAIAQVFARGVFRMAIDLGEVPFMSSAAYCCLLSAHDRARRNRGVVVFVRAQPAIREVFSLLGFSEGLCYAEDFIEARAKLSRQNRG